MTGQDGQSRVQPPRRVREGWDEAFAEMAEQGDDRLLAEMTETEWEDEWEWNIFSCN